MSEIQNAWLLRWKRGQFIHARNHAYRHSTGVDQIDRKPADGLRQRSCGCPAFIGKTQDVDLIAGPVGHAGESGPWRTAHDHTGRARIGATQPKLVGAASCGL